MLIAYKTEINPTKEQKLKIDQTINTCRYVKNMYIEKQGEHYKETGKFFSGYDFSKWLNQYVAETEGLQWVKQSSSKAIKQSIMDTEKAFKRFFGGLGQYPRYKKKRNNDVSMYFVRGGKTTPIHCDRHRIKIPTLGFVKLKEKGYLPTQDNVIRSGRVTKEVDRYYVSVLVEVELQENSTHKTGGLGIDLGIKDLAILSDGRVYPNINKTKKVKNLEKQLKREQRKLSRKYENNKKKGGESATNKNIEKQKVKVQKMHTKLKNIRHDNLNKVINEIVRTKPSYITLEDLKVSNMMRNKHLSKAIAEQMFYTFREKLTQKCTKEQIELRLVSTWYPSSKLCSGCGARKKRLFLSERVYHCDECGLKIDRDANASINLEKAEKYTVIT